MQESSKEFVEYKSFDELPEELKEKYKCVGKLSNTNRIKEGYVSFINLLKKQGDTLFGVYVGIGIKTQIKFGKCGHVASIQPNSYKNGFGCGVCHGKQIQCGVNDLATVCPSLAEEWHPTKNGKLTPYTVTQGSGKRVWWLCKKGHEWEDTINTRSFYATGCPYCSNHRVLRGYNDIATTHSNYIKYFVNVGDSYTHTHSSHKRVKLKCPNCGHIKVMDINTFIRGGFRCPLCSDGTSYPEKLLSSILKKSHIDFIKQMLYTSNKFRYDFFLPSHNAILETHGIQHYEHSNRGRSLKEEQENDRIKRELAIKNGILEEDYHEIDCRYSTLEWCRPNIEKALSNYIDVTVLTDEDWKEADVQAQKSLKVEVCKYWQENKKVDNELTTEQIAKAYAISQSTAWDYLKWGNENGLCTYTGKEHFKRRSNYIYLIKPNGEKWFKEVMNMDELSRQTGISRSTITKNLNKGVLKYHHSSKYDPKYIGSRIVSAEIYDNEIQANQNT